MGFKSKSIDGVRIKDDFFFFNNSIMFINFYQLIIVEYQKSKNFAIKLFLAFFSFVKFDKTFYDNIYIVHILLVNDFEHYYPKFNLVGEKKKVHWRCSHKIN